MRVLVTDATGQVGHRVVTRLLADQHTVSGLVTGEVPGNADDLTYTAWPRADKALAGLLAGIDCVIIPDLAGSWPDGVSLDRLTALIGAAAQNGVKRVVVVGSTRVYRKGGMSTATALEGSPQVARDATDDPLTRAALGLEAALREFGNDIDCVAIRVPEVISPENEAAQAMVRSIIEKAASEVLPEVYQPVDADNLAETLIVAARAPRAVGHAINVAGPLAAAHDDVVREVRRLAAILQEFQPSEVFKRPDYAPAPLAWATDRSRSLLPKVPAKLVWTNLAEVTQQVIHQWRDSGRLAPKEFAMSPAKKAIEYRETPLKGRVAVVTGATDGIGRATALMLAQMGAKVICTGRNKVAGKELIAQMRADKRMVAGRFIAADLTIQAQVHALADKVIEIAPKIDILINNAGAAYGARTETVDGVEATLALNAVAPFLLTQLLSEQLKAADAARVVNVSSDAHRRGLQGLQDLQSTQDYEPMMAYATSKLAGVLLSRALAEQLKNAESTVSIHMVHPGDVRTDIETKNGLNAGVPDDLGPQAKQRMNTIREARRMQLISPEEAAAYVVNVAMSPEFAGKNGLYVSKAEVDQVYNTGSVSQTAWQVWAQCAELAGIEDANGNDAALPAEAPETA
ncbi:hypothetical protein ACMU_12005 [Actibacterium mucosum KCTC 23349]|uniref:NAD(P)-binding domain-containing protein n=1 Tax=Actibacterium mucosum KCTC 23349 TaxID=1454373 RepID=A0A037ZH27_9RHOB|nr:NAD-dependent epimerase/dehydratase family protein [Actibacterium mucosum]KAJ55413.1 hypothetical protein ACMU_12005 [Actibacterium mucosum KCTC 23349]